MAVTYGGYIWRLHMAHRLVAQADDQLGAAQQREARALPLGAPPPPRHSVALLLRGRYVAVKWRLRGGYVAVTRRQLSGSGRTVPLVHGTWRLRGGYVAVTWRQLSGSGRTVPLVHGTLGPPPRVAASVGSVACLR